MSANPRGYCPNHATGVKLPDDLVVNAPPVRGLGEQCAGGTPTGMTLPHDDPEVTR